MSHNRLSDREREEWTTPVASDFVVLDDADEQRARDIVLAKLAAEPELYLGGYATRFGNVLNADDAATLFDEYNVDRAKYRVAVHPAATWIRDEMFQRVLAAEPLNAADNRVIFTAGGNASGKSTALAMIQARYRAHAVFDSTLAGAEHASRLIAATLAANKRVTILYVSRPLIEAFTGMLERSRDEGRVVAIDQLIRSAEGAAATVRSLWADFRGDTRFEFVFIENTAVRTREGGVDLAAPRGYTEIRLRLYELLENEYRSGRIGGDQFLRIRGYRERREPEKGS